MTRAFLPDPVPADVLLEVLELGRRVPSAGNSQGFDFVVLEGPDQTKRYWDVTLSPQRRERFKWPDLLVCPVLITVWANQAAYISRYSEPDKASTRLDDPTAWETPYWLVDASFAALALQYAAINAGLGVLFFGMFNHTAAVRAELGVPGDRSGVGTLALGWPVPQTSDKHRPGRSAARPQRPLVGSSPENLEPVAHFGGW